MNVMEGGGSRQSRLDLGHAFSNTLDLHTFVLYMRPAGIGMNHHADVPSKKKSSIPFRVLIATERRGGSQSRGRGATPVNLDAPKTFPW